MNPGREMVEPLVCHHGARQALVCPGHHGARQALVCLGHHGARQALVCLGHHGDMAENEPRFAAIKDVIAKKVC